MTVTGSGSTKSAMRSTSPAPAQVVDQAVDDGLDPRPHRLDGPRRERLEDEPPEPRVIGRLEVEHPGVVELVERGVPGRRLRPAQLGVRRLVEIRPSETGGRAAAG